MITFRVFRPTKMNSIEILKQLASGKRVIGTLLTNASPYWPQKVAELDFDFVFIDTEHIAFDRVQISSLCHNYRARNIAPFVRIPSPDPYQASMVSDDGACGIIAPYVETVEQVKKLVGAVKLKPIKGEIQSQLLDGSNFKSEELRRYIETANADKILVINIESVPDIIAFRETMQRDLSAIRERLGENEAKGKGGALNI